MYSSKLKKLILVLSLLAISFTTYVAIINRNSANMTVRQKILKAVYPILMAFSGKKNKAKPSSMNTTSFSASFYSLKTITNQGTQFDFSQLKGKKVLLVNTASDCGYTPQYADLQKLYEQYKEKLVIIGFPANDFKEQEKGDDEQIASFCKVNYGVTFPLAQKSSVVKGNQQNEVFNWLSDKNKNGWNDKQPTWNFSKYLVDESGVLTNYFDPAISPISEEVINAIK
jgi:glutathione peroxidase